MSCKLDIARHNLETFICQAQLSSSRQNMVLNRAHELPPALASFKGLGKFPFNLNDVVSCDNLYVIDLRVIRQFCDMTNTVLRNHSNSSFDKAN